MPHLKVCVPLLLAVIGVYGQTLGHDFLSNWDDNVYISQNTAIRGFSADHVRQAFSSVFVGNYAPVQMLSYMLDYTVWGMRASGFHLTNLVIHAGNGLLFYLLMFRLSGRRAWAFIAAALFLLHPVQVESVAWLSQRKTVLAMFFYLIALLAYHAYRQRLPGKGYQLYLLALTSCCLALLCKSVTVILPLTLVLIDYCFAAPQGRTRQWTDKIPFFIAAVLVGVVTIVVQSPALGGGRANPFVNAPPLSTFFTMLTVLARYLWMLLWPADLSPLYLPPAKLAIDGEVLLAALLAAALITAGIVLARRSRRYFFGYALFFIGLLPVSQIVPLVTIMNDRYLYFPLMGVAWLAGGLFCRMSDSGPTWRRSCSVAICGCAITGLALVSFQRTKVWENAVTLWRDTAPKLPGSWEVRAALADAQFNAGMYPGALGTYSELFQLRSDAVDPDLESKALNNAAVLYMQYGMPDRALPLLRRLTERFSGYLPGHINLGNCLKAMKRNSEARQAYLAALALEPDNPLTLALLGNVSLEMGELSAARTYYRQVVARGDEGPDMQFNLACLEARSGHESEALRYLEEALRRGFRDYANITNNQALSSLRKLPAYQQLLQAYVPKAAR